MQGRHQIGIFQPRQCDFQTGKKSGRPLSKEGNRLQKTDAPKYAGASSFGPFSIASSKDSHSTLYYLSNHCITEYFAIETLQLLGIHAPKIRLIAGDIPEVATPPNHTFFVNYASKGVADLIPMCFINGRAKPSSRVTDPHDPRLRYRLVTDKQMVFDRIENKHYRISGNTYASFIAAKLIDDDDFKEQRDNFNLIRIGNRFYCIAIDKSLARFSGKEHYSLSWQESEFKLYCEEEQKLAVITAIADALIIAEDGLCTFDRIFSNSRVKATPFVGDKADEFAANIKITAQSLVDIFLRRDPDILKKYAERENWRADIARLITSYLALPDHIHANDLQQLIIQDLRGPFYKHLFIDGTQISRADCDSEDLLNVIAKDFREEFELQAKQSDRRIVF